MKLGIIMPKMHIASIDIIKNKKYSVRLHVLSLLTFKIKMRLKFNISQISKQYK